MHTCYPTINSTILDGSNLEHKRDLILDMREN